VLAHATFPASLICLARNRLFWIAVGVWIATRALIVGDVGFWHDAGPRLQDVNNYEVWSHYLTARDAIPGGESWQYPPGAAFLMLLPRLGPGTYGEAFVGLMLLVDLAGLALLALLGRRSGNYTGVWVWLLGMPLLGTFSVLRFDLVPAVIGIAALVVIHRRPNWFGALAGLGAAIKVWPIVLLFGEWDRRRLLRAAAAALATIVLVLVVSVLAFGDPTSFLGEQSGRGLQEEAVATVPWHVQAIFTGEAPAREIRSGAWEIATPGADTVAGLLEWLSLAALGAAAAWWWYRARAIRAGRVHLADAAVSRDFVFTIVLLLVVTSRVLSPQFMVWLLGLSAVILTAGSTRLARPAWLVLGAAILSTSLFKSPENIVIRDLALLAAAADASLAMIGMLRDPLAPKDPAEPETGTAQAELSSTTEPATPR
jgi:glycosyl transferase family 87